MYANSLIASALLGILGFTGTDAQVQPGKLLAYNSVANLDKVQFPKGLTSASLPFEDDFGLIFVECRINGSSPLWFILDTGFDTNIINSSVISALGIRLENEQVVPQPGGAIRMGDARDLLIALGPISTRESARSAPLSSLQPLVGRRIDGILGHEFLSKFVVEIDYDRKKLTFRSPAHLANLRGSTPLPVKVLDKQPFVPAKIIRLDGVVKEGQFKLDTGSTDGVGFNKNFLEDNDILLKSQAVIEEPGAGVGGETKSIRFRLGAVRLGEFVLSYPAAGATLEAGGFENRADAGTIGAALLSRFKVTLDYARNRILLKPGRNFSKPFVQDRSGLRLVAEGFNFDRFMVSGVLKGSPGERAGIRAGDTIEAINGTPASRFSLWELKSKLLEARRDIRLRMRRDGRSWTVLLRPQNTI